MNLSIAGEVWSVDRAVAVCDWYAEELSSTLELYDFGGTDSAPHAHDTVDLSDVGRLTVINARLRPDNAVSMIKAAEDAPWDAVAHTDDILTTEDVPELLRRATDLYHHFRVVGKLAQRRTLGPTQSHKLLHLKRPRVFPIVDSVVRRVYAQAAIADGLSARGRQPTCWPALARDMRANRDAYADLVKRVPAVARLTVPRLHDILVWSLHGSSRDAVRDRVAGKH